jgi:hypothetical protein
MTCRSGAEISDHYERHKAFYEERGPTKPFEVGKTYLRHDGVAVRCIEINERGSCARFDDGDLRWHFTGGYERRAEVGGGYEPVKWHASTSGWRYNYDADRGRCTGTDFDDPRSVVPEPADGSVRDVFYIKHTPTGHYLTEPAKDAWSLSSYGRHWFMYRDRAEMERDRLARLHPEIADYDSQLVVEAGPPPVSPR